MRAILSKELFDFIIQLDSERWAWGTQAQRWERIYHQGQEEVKEHIERIDRTVKQTWIVLPHIRAWSKDWR